jgi:hypothetical protein
MAALGINTLFHDLLDAKKKTEWAAGLHRALRGEVAPEICWRQKNNEAQWRCAPLRVAAY